MRIAGIGRGWLLGLLTVGAVHCSSGSGGPQGDDAGVAGAGGSTSAWGDTSCGACVQARCDAERVACVADPTCAAHVKCVGACAPGPDGDVDAACAAACPAAQGSTAEALIADWTTCRRSAAATCTDCGGMGAAGAAGGGGSSGSGGSGATHPLLEQTCDPSAETNECFSCEEEQCCETYATCKGDPACDGYATCMRDDCPLAYTLKQCVEFCDAQEGTQGFDAFFTRLACVTALCAVECGGAGDPCVDCVNAECLYERVACDVDESCQRLSFCIEDCTTDTCFSDCEAQFPDGKAASDAFTECVLVSCVDECG